MFHFRSSIGASRRQMRTPKYSSLSYAVHDEPYCTAHNCMCSRRPAKWRARGILTYATSLRASCYLTHARNLQYTVLYWRRAVGRHPLQSANEFGFNQNAIYLSHVHRSCSSNMTRRLCLQNETPEPRLFLLITFLSVAIDLTIL